MKDGLLQEVDCSNGVVLLPLVEDLMLVDFVQVLRNLNVFRCGLHTLLVASQNVVFRLEFVDGGLDTGNDGASPGDRAGVGGHILWDWWLLLICVVQRIHGVKFFQVLLKDVLVLVSKLLLNLRAGLDVLKLREEFKGTV